MWKWWCNSTIPRELPNEIENAQGQLHLLQVLLQGSGQCGSLEAPIHWLLVQMTWEPLPMQSSKTTTSRGCTTTSLITQTAPSKQNTIWQTSRIFLMMMKTATRPTSSVVIRTWWKLLCWMTMTAVMTVLLLVNTLWYSMKIPQQQIQGSQEVAENVGKSCQH